MQVHGTNASLQNINGATSSVGLHSSPAAVSNVAVSKIIHPTPGGPLSPSRHVNLTTVSQTVEEY